MVLLNTLASLDAAHAVHPHTNLRRHLETGPNMITRGEGIHVFDEDGKDYIEGAAGLWCASLGFGNARLGEVAKRVMTDIGYYHSFRGASTPSAAEFSAKLAEITPPGMDKVLLQSSGSEANDTAIKLVWHYWQAKGMPNRRKIISRLGGYHGTGALTACLTGKSNFHAGFGLPFDGFLYTSQPYYYRNAAENETEEEYTDRLVNDLETLIQKEGPETIAAFWAEPVMGSGGAITPPAGYFPKIQAVLDKYDILFVADEVICGFARTGEMWGSQTYNIRPDMICSAKALSAAMVPLSALIIGPRVFEAMLERSDHYGTFVHGYTYGGHPMACAVAHEVLKIYEEMDLVNRVKGLSKGFLTQLEKLNTHPLIGDARGVGLIGAVEVVSDKKTKAKFDASTQIMPKFEAIARKNGLIVRLIENRIALSPPLIITSDEITEMFSRLEASLDEVANTLD